MSTTGNPGGGPALFPVGASGAGVAWRNQDTLHALGCDPAAGALAPLAAAPIDGTAHVGLLRALTDNLGKFEAQFGEIKAPEQPFADERPIGFKR